MGKSHDEGFRRVEKGFGEARMALSWVFVLRSLGKPKLRDAID